SRTDSPPLAPGARWRRLPEHAPSGTQQAAPAAQEKRDSEGPCGFPIATPVPPPRPAIARQRPADAFADPTAAQRVSSDLAIPPRFARGPARDFPGALHPLPVDRWGTPPGGVAGGVGMKMPALALGRGRLGAALGTPFRGGTAAAPERARSSPVAPERLPV